MANGKTANQHIEQLSELISAGLVIPIVGSDLLKVERGNNKSLSLMNHVAREIASNEKLKVKNVDIDDIHHRLPQSSDIHLLVRKRIMSIIKKDNIKSDCFEKLAKIKTFKVFFNASCTDILNYYVRTYREDCREYSFYNIDSAKPQDVEADDIEDLDIHAIRNPILYNLFGHFDSQNLKYILTEDDFIEFIFDLKKYNNKLNNLKSILEHPRVTILFIGCDFPNWLFRFFIRALIDRPLDELKRRRIMVADSLVERDTARTIFFNKYQITQLEGLDPESLVNGIYEYLKSNIPDSINEDFTQNIAFISYASEDVEIVRLLNKQLSNYGVDTWFDIQIIKRGEEFREEIRKGIDRACVFIPIISENSVQGNKKRHYRREWSYAIGKHQRKENDIRILPVVIDGTEDDAHGIPKEFWDKNKERINGSLDLSKEFLDRVKEIQANKRKNVLIAD